MAALNLNMNFADSVYIDASSMSWTSSPRPGVFRKRLEAENQESGRATAIVKYAPGSAFHSHRHDRGEEFLVLDGVFSDERKNYHAGEYVRNPPDSVHAPFSKKGCVIFVKLCQMQSSDDPALSVDTAQLTNTPGSTDGHEVSTLYQSAHEWVKVERLRAGTEITLPATLNGYEFLVLNGDIIIDERRLSPLSWGRIPVGRLSRLKSENGCVLWSKQGHLAFL